MNIFSLKELQHLFDKLDVDMDGRVSFHEFLHGLFQHGGSGTPTATPVRPPSLPRQKLRVSVMNFEDRPQTPSFITALSGLFSTLDPEGTGCVPKNVNFIFNIFAEFSIINYSRQCLLSRCPLNPITKVCFMGD